MWFLMMNQKEIQQWSAREKLNLSECTALLQRHFRNLVLHTQTWCVCLLSLRTSTFFFHITFHTTSSGMTQHLEVGGSNSSKGWVPGSLTSEPRTKHFLSSPEKNTADRSSLLSNIPLSTHFHPIQYFSLGFYSSSLLTSTFCMIIFFFLFPHPHCCPVGLCKTFLVWWCLTIALYVMAFTVVIRVLFTLLSVLLTFNWSASAVEIRDILTAQCITGQVLWTWPEVRMRSMYSISTHFL